MTKRIAIIPARGGSKRIPGKNINNFCGKPIISYILEEVKKSELFDVIHISTDSEEIKKVVQDLGFLVDFMRDEALSDDYTPIMPVLKWVLEEYNSRGECFDEVAMIMPCTPFIDSDDLVNASKLSKAGNYKKPVLAVSLYSAPIEWAFTLAEDQILKPVNKEILEKRSQDLEDHYFDTGSFCFFSSKYILNSKGAGINKSYIGYVIDKYRSIDIDDINDWKFAEAIYRRINF